MDAYTSVSAPFHMTTVEFFSSVKEHLNIDGLMMMNINMTSNAPGSINQALCDTAYSVFNNLYTYKVYNGSGIEAYAYNGNKDVLYEVEHATYPTSLVGFSNVINQLKFNLRKHEDTGIRLYDETADVEIRSMRALAEIIRDYLDYYIQIFRERGLQGLIEVLMQ